MKNHKFIELSQGKRAKVSLEDYEYLKGYRWFAQKASGVRAHEIWYGYTNIYIKKSLLRVAMHRAVLARKLEDPVFFVDTNRHVDHLNLDGLDNTRENLRACTTRENQMHKRIQRNNTSGFKGVGFDNRTEKYFVRFTVANRTRVFGGYFRTAEEAARRYNEMAVQHFGRFALLNDVGGDTS